MDEDLPAVGVEAKRQYVPPGKLCFQIGRTREPKSRSRNSRRNLSAVGRSGPGAESHACDFWKVAFHENSRIGLAPPFLYSYSLQPLPEGRKFLIRFFLVFRIGKQMRAGTLIGPFIATPCLSDFVRRWGGLGGI